MSIEVACLRPANACSRRDREREGRAQVEPLNVFWPADAKIRINNRSDRTKPYHNEQVIRGQISYVSCIQTLACDSCLITFVYLGSRRVGKVGLDIREYPRSNKILLIY